MRKEHIFKRNRINIQLLDSKSSQVINEKKLIGKNVEILSIENRVLKGKGQIKSIEGEHLTIINSKGIEEIHELLEIIVVILPLIEQIIMFFKRIFSKNNMT